jgi:aminopeptidase N
LRGQAGHDAFAAYARALLQPVADRLGWDGRADESSGTQKLRRAVLGNLGAWGDAAVVAEARRRFAAFAADRSAVRPDDQEMVLSIVARNADTASFEQLHAVARTARNDIELQRYYAALSRVRDPLLAAQAARVALSDEISEQAQAVRLTLIVEIADQNPQLAWTTFTRNADLILKPQGQFAPLIVAQDAPEAFWEGASPDVIEAWVRARVPAEMADSIARGMESARFSIAEKSAIAQAAARFIEADAGTAQSGGGTAALLP